MKSNDFEPLIKDKMLELSKKEIAKMEENTSEHNFSNDFNQSMEKIISSSGSNDEKLKKRKSLRISKKAACFISVILVLSFVSFSVEASRNFIISMTVKVREEFTQVFIDKESDIINTELSFKKPKYIPEDFILVDEERNKNSYFLVYENKNKERIFYTQSKLSDKKSMIIDTENVKLEFMEVAGAKITYFYNKDEYNFTWYRGDEKYTIISTIEKEEIIKMIESILTK